MVEPVKVLAIDSGLMMDAPEMRELFKRAYADSDLDVDTTAVCDFLSKELESPDEWLKLFVAWGEQVGFVGMSLLVLHVDPISPYPWVSHLYADVRGVRAVLVDAVLGHLRSKGFGRFACYNGSRYDDRAYKSIFENSGLRLHVKGSMMIGELKWD